MGGGSYSSVSSSIREADYKTRTTESIFTQKRITNLMDPKNTFRECCDSEEHPETIPVIIALDVTGSMGYVPDKFIREEMTKMMAGLYEAGLTDSQVLFMGIGDHECDSAPLQVGQFEADDQLLDKWLKDIYLEGGGGGNKGESYLLAWYYAARHTKIDSFDKRGKKGFLFTIGDEPNLKQLSVDHQRRIFGENGDYETITSENILKEASEKYNVFHLHLKETASGSRPKVQDGWKQTLQDNAVILESYSEIAGTVTAVLKQDCSKIVNLSSEPETQKEENIL
jgi:hypothetical protein